MTPHPRQLLLDGRTLEEADGAEPVTHPSPALLVARLSDVDGRRTLADLGLLWRPAYASDARARFALDVLREMEREGLIEPLPRMVVAREHEGFVARRGA